jgi:hypothetical protein
LSRELSSDSPRGGGEGGDLDLVERTNGVEHARLFILRRSVPTPSVTCSDMREMCSLVDDLGTVLGLSEHQESGSWIPRLDVLQQRHHLLVDPIQHFKHWFQPEPAVDEDGPDDRFEAVSEHLRGVPDPSEVDEDLGPGERLGLGRGGVHEGVKTGRGVEDVALGVEDADGEVREGGVGDEEGTEEGEVARGRRGEESQESIGRPEVEDGSKGTGQRLFGS